MTSDQIEQAVIGFGSAVLGAIIGGAFVLRAARDQWAHDREANRTDASRQSARRLIVELAQLEGAVATWVATGIERDKLATAFNAFSTAAVADLPFITDDNVSSRVNAHIELAHSVVRVASTMVVPKEMLEAVRRHADAVTESLEAHIRHQPLPDYKPLPRTEDGVLDASVVMAWPDRAQHLAQS